MFPPLRAELLFSSALYHTTTGEEDGFYGGSWGFCVKLTGSVQDGCQEDDQEQEGDFQDVVSFSIVFFVHVLSPLFFSFQMG